MKYNDLESFYFENFLEMKKYIQPNVKTIGWLNKDSCFNQGTFPNREEILNKLKILTILDNQPTALTRKNKKNKKNKIITIVHTDFTRGGPYKCPFCNQEIHIQNNILGVSRIIIPSVIDYYVYTFPSLLYHYIDVHNYIPPNEFLISLEQFSLQKNFSYNTPFGNKKIDSLIYETYTIDITD